MNIYQSEDYKFVLKNTLLHKKAHSKSQEYSFQKMAQYCRIEKAYLSRALNNDSHLSQDQLYLACQYLEFTKDERDYVLLLHVYARTSLSSYREELHSEIMRRRARGGMPGSMPRRIDALDTDTQAVEFFLNPTARVVQAMMHIDKYAADPQKIAEVLGLSQKGMLKVLSFLESRDFVDKDKDRYRPKRNSLCLPAKSRFHNSAHCLMNMKSMERFQNELFFGFIYSAPFSTEPRLFRDMVVEMSQFTSKYEKLIDDGPHQEAYQLNVQLFPWASNWEG